MQLEIWINYFGKESLKNQTENIKKTPYFNLLEGLEGDDSYCSFNKAENFPEITLAILRHLKENAEYGETYTVGLSQEAYNQIGIDKKQVLERILALHNDSITKKS